MRQICGLEALLFNGKTSSFRRLTAVSALAAALSASAAHAGWREDIGTFRIGMVAQPGAGQTVLGLSRIKEAFSKVLAMPVEVFVARDLPALIDAQVSERIEYAVYPATAYAVAWRMCACVEPIAASIGEDGSVGLRAVLVSRAKVSDVTKLSGVRIAVPPAAAVAGNLLALGGLAAAGIDLPASGAVLVEADSAAAAEQMFVDNAVDAVLGWESAKSGGEAPEGTQARLVAAGVDAASLKLLWRSELLRYGPHAIRLGLDPEIKAALVPFLTGLRDVLPDVYDLLETQHGGGFLPASQQDYATAVEMVEYAAGTNPQQ